MLFHMFPGIPQGIPHEPWGMCMGNRGNTGESGEYRGITNSRGNYPQYQGNENGECTT